MNEEIEYDEHPCTNCPEAEYCDHWEAMFCCALCHFNGCEHCEDCDPMDI